jgi:hypothetical protein
MYRSLLNEVTLSMVIFQIGTDRYSDRQEQEYTAPEHAVVNFINILRTNFSYERHCGSFIYVYVTREKLQKRRLYEKFERKMLIKLTPD